MKLEHSVHEARLRAPFLTARGSVDHVRRVHVTLRAQDGVVGRGEATVLPWYDGTELGEVIAALRVWRPDGPLPDLPHAAAAIDMALWDLRGRREGVPVWRLLGAERAEPVEVNATIAAEDRASAAAQAARARAAGFTCVKVKVGTGDDAARVAAVRAAAGPSMRIRLDANGAWSAEEARRWLEVLEPAGIELCEEPVHGLEALKALAAATPMTIALDESASLPGALERRWADAICLKVIRCGGIAGLLRDAARARALGYGVYLASTLDGPLGIAAALHAATAIRPDRPSGLATLALFEADDPFPAAGGRITPPAHSGL